MNSLIKIVKNINPTTHHSGSDNIGNIILSIDTTINTKPETQSKTQIIKVETYSAQTIAKI